MRRTLAKFLLAAVLVSSVFAAWRYDLFGWVAAGIVSAQIGPATVPANFPDVVIPFELANEHIFLTTSVNNSRPLQFMLDTGDKYTLIDLTLAQELNLTLGSDIAVHGAGVGTTRGAFVKGASFTLPTFRGFTQPVALAIPLRNLAPRLGHDVDGLLGSDFLQQFVVELDYQKHMLPKLRSGFPYLRDSCPMSFATCIMTCTHNEDALS